MRLNALLLTLVFPVISHAFSYIDNRGLLPIGEVEAFMANTGVALAGSTGAVYYNPAGLASLTQNHLSISANSYLSTKSDLDPLQTIDGVDLDFHVSGLQTIPTSFVSTGHFGDWIYAFSILIPHQLKIQDSTLYSTPHYPQMQYSRTNSFQLLQVGPSVATRVGLWDLGVGCFYTMHSTTQESSFTAGSQGGTSALVINDYFDANVNGVMCNAGTQVQLTLPLRAGLTLRSPFIATSKNGTSMQFVQNPNNGQSALVGPKGVEADAKIPFDASFGLEYKVSDDLTGYADASLQLAQTQNSGDIGAEDNHNHAVVRVSGGAKYNVSKVWEAYGGVAYNPSSVDTTFADYAENFVEYTLGSRWTYSNTNLGIGVMYANSSGSKMSAIYDSSLNQLGQKTANVTTRAVGVLLSSGYLF